MYFSWIDSVDYLTRLPPILFNFPAEPGNRYLEALARRLRRKTGGRASASASPGRAGEREEYQHLKDFQYF